MSDRLIDHIINNLNYKFDDLIKTKIKKYYVPKHVDIDTDIKIYEEYRELIPRRISTLSLPKIIRNIVLYFRNRNYKMYDNSLYGLSLSYLHSIEDQDLCYFEFDCHKTDCAIIGYSSNNTKVCFLNNIIYELVGNEWKETYIGKYPDSSEYPDPEYDYPDAIDIMMINEYLN